MDLDAKFPVHWIVADSRRLEIGDDEDKFRDDSEEQDLSKNDNICSVFHFALKSQSLCVMGDGKQTDTTWSEDSEVCCKILEGKYYFLHPMRLLTCHPRFCF